MVILHRPIWPAITIAAYNIVAYDGKQVTFRYRDSQTQDWQTLTEPADRFLWQVLQHVLPKGLRRLREYGFLHIGARRKQRTCPCCGRPLNLAFWRQLCRWPVIRRRCTE